MLPFQWWIFVRRQGLVKVDRHAPTLEASVPASWVCWPRNAVVVMHCEEAIIDISDVVGFAQAQYGKFILSEYIRTSSSRVFRLWIFKLMTLSFVTVSKSRWLSRL